MGADAYWPFLAALGAIAGGVCGAAYAVARRKFVALGARRIAGEPLGLKGRAIAGVYGFVMTAVPGTVVTVNPILGLMGGAVGFVTAVLLPGDADIVRDA